MERFLLAGLFDARGFGLAWCDFFAARFADALAFFLLFRSSPLHVRPVF